MTQLVGTMYRRIPRTNARLRTIAVSGRLMAACRRWCSGAPLDQDRYSRLEELADPSPRSPQGGSCSPSGSPAPVTTASDARYAVRSHVRMSCQCLNRPSPEPCSDVRDSQSREHDDRSPTASGRPSTLPTGSVSRPARRRLSAGRRIAADELRSTQCTVVRLDRRRTSREAPLVWLRQCALPRLSQRPSVQQRVCSPQENDST